MDSEQAINQRIFETSLDLILVVDRKGTFIRVSPSAKAILGYAPLEMIGRSAAEFLYPEDLDSTRSEMRKARRGRHMRNFECRYIHKDGHVVPLAWTGVWSDPEQQHFFIGRDMTERIAGEERLRRAQRLESVGQLTGGIAHDFNNLLAVVIGNLDLLQERVRDDADGAEIVRAALDAAMRGAKLTGQLLAFARRQPLDAKVIAVNARVSAVMDLLRRTIGEQIEIATVLAPDLWTVTVDPVQLESALVNLAINARDAMAGGGRLTIETANKQLDGVYARENPETVPGDYVMLAVSDNGAGMTPEISARVFEPFFTTKEAGKGTGLGLSMVYGFIKQSGGHVKIYSEIGRGTTVRLYLPRAVADAAHVEPDMQEAAAPARKGERILVVEDNPDVRNMVLRQLTELGYHTLEAGDANAALVLLQNGVEIDLLFTDVVMPGGKDGPALAREALTLKPGIKVLFTSGFTQAGVNGNGKEPLTGPLLSKPYRKQQLAAKLREVLDG